MLRPQPKTKKISFGASQIDKQTWQLRVSIKEDSSVFTGKQNSEYLKQYLKYFV